MPDENSEITVDLLPSLAQLNGYSADINSAKPVGDSSSLAQLVEGAFNRLLGVDVDGTDAATIQTSLANAFTEKEVSGRTVYQWNSHSYTAATGDFSGSVTGAQASLYYRAKIIRDNILKLVKQLKPLDPAADPENITAVKGIVQTEIKALVQELGSPDGPVKQKVEDRFRQLLGVSAEGVVNIGDPTLAERSENPTIQALVNELGTRLNVPSNGINALLAFFDAGPDTQGTLGQLGKQLGLDTDRINTLDEEENYSNFLIVRDSIVSLQKSWADYLANQTAYLGSHLVEILRALAVVAESVREASRIMNLYFLGAQERHALAINFRDAIDDERLVLPSGNLPYNSDGTPRYVENEVPTNIPSYAPNLGQDMTLGDLLDWTMSFATEEGPQLAKVGGKIGISYALKEKAFVLKVLFHAAVIALDPGEDNAVVHAAFRREGTLDSLRNIALHLVEIEQLASSIDPAPSAANNRNGDDNGSELIDPS